MKIKKAALLLLTCNSLNLFSQKDSIVNYLDRRFRNTINKEHTKYIETKVKNDKDTVWRISTYYRDGKILSKGFSKISSREEYINKYVSYHRNGKLAKKAFYNYNGELHGKIVTLFDNGKRNYTGSYVKGDPVGLWKYYRYNGKLAAKFYHDKNGDVEKYLLLDESGNELKDEEYIKLQKPIFKGGEKSFRARVMNLMSNLSYAVNTTLYINFTIDVDGTIRDVWVVNNIPKKLKNEISDFFESIKGWSPAIDMNRKVPYRYGLPFTIKTRVISD